MKRGNSLSVIPSRFSQQTRVSNFALLSSMRDCFIREAKLTKSGWTHVKGVGYDTAHNDLF